MQLMEKLMQIGAMAALVSGMAVAGVPAAETSQDNTVTLNPEFSLDNGDYGSGETITTYATSITGEYSFAERWTVSVTLVPYQYQNETYTDVVLIRGQPIHHADASGDHAHHVDTRIHSSGDLHHLNKGHSLPHFDQHVSHAGQPKLQPEPTPHTGKPSQGDRPKTGSHSLKSSRAMAAPSGNIRASRAQAGPATNAAPASVPKPAQPEPVEQRIRRHGSTSGVGDTMVDVFYELVKENDALPETSLHGGVKLPTADEEKGLGTGELDYLMGFALGRTIDRWYLSGGLDYNIPGDPDDYELDNYVSGYASVATEVTEALEVSIELSAAQAATDFSDTSVDMSLGVTYCLDDSGTVTAGAQMGLTDGSPDYGIRVGYFISF